MQRNHCTLLPKSWKVTQILNNAGICARHDSDYVQQIITRKEADRVFLENCLFAGISVWLSVTMYAACRLGGWFLWYRRKWRK